MIRCYNLDAASMIDSFLPFAKHSDGIFSDTMIHDFDTARWLCDDEIAMVHAIGGVYKYDELRQYNDVDNATCLGQLRGGAMALFFAGRTAAHGYHVETEIIGTEAAIRINGVPRENNIVIYGRSGVRTECVQHFQQHFGPAYLNEMQAFVDCIHTKADAPVGARDALQAAVVAGAATVSYKQKRAIHISADGEYS